MKQKYVQGIELVNEEKYQEAYDFFQELLEKDQNDVGARYYRATIDFFYLKQNLKLSYEDMKIVSIKGTKEAKKATYTLLCVLAEEFDEYDKVIEYGLLAQNNRSQYSETLYPTLGRAYYILGINARGNEEYFKKSLDCFQKALELFPDDKIDLYKSLVDVYYRLDRFEDCLEYTQKLMSLGVNDGILYFYRGVCHFYLASEEEDYEDAIYNFDKSLNYNPDDEETTYFRALALGSIGKEEESDKILMDLYNKDKNQSLLNGIFHFYANNKKIDKIYKFKDNEEVLKNLPNKLFIAKSLDFYGDDAQRLQGLKYYKELFEETKDIDILQLIFGSYSISDDYNGMIDYAKSILALNDVEYPNEYLKETIAQSYRLSGESYEKQKELLEPLKNKGMFIDEYIYLELFINPNRDYKKLSKMIKGSFFKTIDPRLQCSILLYGDYPIKKNHKLLLKSVKLLKGVEYHSCTLTLLGRINELVFSDNKKAHEFYKKAYELIIDNCSDYCNCAAGFFAHSLINGFNDEINEQEAIRIILREIDKKKFTQSPNVSFIYSYLALKGTDGFSIDTAIKLLLKARFDSIYDLDCIYLLMKCYENINMEESSKYLNMFYENLNYTNQLQKEYYISKMKNSQIDSEELIYPFLTNR